MLYLNMLIFAFSGLNNLSLIIYFQSHYYFIYHVDDIKMIKKEIYFNFNLHHNTVSFQTIFNCWGVIQKVCLLETSSFWPPFPLVHSCSPAPPPTQHSVMLTTLILNKKSVGGGGKEGGGGGGKKREKSYFFCKLSIKD